MLALLDRPRPAIHLVPRDFAWGNDLAAVTTLVARYFSDCNGNGFFPHPAEVALRRELRTIRALDTLTRKIRGRGARALAVTHLGLAELDAAQRNAVLYAIALCLGYPTSTDPRSRRVAWDVRARPDTGPDIGPDTGPTTRFVTFSERVGSADMHTDSSFHPMPEEQFLLYVVAAARCGGGESLLIDVDEVYGELQASAAGRAACALLSDTPLPFRVPSVYAADDEQVEVTLAPVFQRPAALGGGVAMRWRHDAILQGLAARPDLDSPALRAAVGLLDDLIEPRRPRKPHFSAPLPDDTLLWVDNRRTLHGRSAYTDPARHLIRIRMSDVPNADRVGPSGAALD